MLPKRYCTHHSHLHGPSLPIADFHRMLFSSSKYCWKLIVFFSLYCIHIQVSLILCTAHHSGNISFYLQFCINHSNMFYYHKLLWDNASKNFNKIVEDFTSLSSLLTPTEEKPNYFDRLTLSNSESLWNNYWITF